VRVMLIIIAKALPIPILYFRRKINPSCKGKIIVVLKISKALTPKHNKNLNSFQENTSKH
jgi:hypothetical protein